MNKNFLVVSFIIFLSFLPNKKDIMAASFYLSPSSGTFTVGSTFDVSIFMNSEGESVNAVQVDLSFSEDKIQIVNPTTGRSFISVWVDQPYFSNQEGFISFKGGVPTPGINTTAGLVSTITFRVRSVGKASIRFKETSMVLLADGEGTNVLETTMEGEYDLIVPPPEGVTVLSSTHPSLATWYRNNNPTFSWHREQGVTDFSYTLDQDPTGVPDNISEGNQTSVSFAEVEDGIWYFHIKARKDGVWGKTSHYSVRIDSTPPRNFDVSIEKMGGLGGTKFLAYFQTDDFLSGTDHYEVSVADNSDPQATANPFFVETISPYKIPYETAGEYLILVRAFDKAGNYLQKEEILNVVNPFFSYNEAGVIIGGFFLGWTGVYLFLAILLILFLTGVYLIIRDKNLTLRLKKEIKEAEREIADVKKIERRIEKMRLLEEEAKKESERLTQKLKE